MPHRFWELAAGALIAVSQQYESWQQRLEEYIPFLPFVFSTLPFVFSTLAAVVLMLSFVLTPNHSGFPFPWALPAVCGTVLFILAGIPETCAAWFNYSCGLPAPVYVGKVSYAIYLWHWPVLVLFNYLVGPDAMTRSPLLIVLYLLLVGGPSCLGYHWIEKPLQSFKPKCLGGVLTTALVAAFLVSSGLILSQRWAEQSTQGPSGQEANYNYIYDACTAPQQDNICRETCDCSCYVNIDTFHKPPGARYRKAEADVPCFAEGGEPGEAKWPESHGYWLNGSFKACYIWDGHPNQIHWCLNTTGRTPGRSKLFFIGDSTAAAHADSMMCALKRQFDYEYFTMPNKFWIANGDFAGELNELFLQILRPGDIVMFTFWARAFHNMSFLDAVNKRFPLDYPCQPPDYPITAMLRTLQPSIASKGAHLVLMDSTHDLFDTEEFKAGHNQPAMFCKSPGTCQLPLAVVQARRRCWEDVASVFTSKPNTHLISIYKLLCQDDQCLPQVPGTGVLAFNDGLHMSYAGSLYFWPFVCAALKQKGLSKGCSSCGLGWPTWVT